MAIHNLLTEQKSEGLIQGIKNRFINYPHPQAKWDWTEIERRLRMHPEKLWSLNEMERTGGEPNVVKQDKETGAFIFYDCSKESPTGRRSLCYDRKGLESRKDHPPKNSAVDLAHAMGVDLLTEEEYRALQTLGEYDAKTSSWLRTPADIRYLGGAIFGDYRFGHVFIYHNGAQSYYSNRGFRASLVI